MWIISGTIQTTQPGLLQSLNLLPPSWLVKEESFYSFFFLFSFKAITSTQADKFKRSFLDMLSHHSFFPDFSASLSLHRLFSLRPEHTPVYCLLNTNIPSRLLLLTRPSLGLYFLSLPSFLKRGLLYSLPPIPHLRFTPNLCTACPVQTLLSTEPGVTLGQRPLLNPVSLNLPGEGDIG